jgi:hypothetical protein
MKFMSKKRTLLGIFSLSAILLPVVCSAQDLNLESSTFSTIVSYIVDILNLLIPVLIGVAFLFFFWGLSKFILSGSGSQADRKKGKDYMLWGILALFILVSFRAIISIVATDLGIKNPNNTSQSWTPRLPQ